MVKQDLIEQAMNALNRPCTTKDIEKYLVDNKLVPNYEWDIKIAIATGLKSLKRWEVVDHVLQGHSNCRSKVWFLIKNGKPKHDPKTCLECRGVNHAFNNHLGNFRSYRQRVKKHSTNAAKYHEDSVMSEGFRTGFMA